MTRNAKEPFQLFRVSKLIFAPTLEKFRIFNQHIYNYILKKSNCIRTSFVLWAINAF